MSIHYLKRAAGTALMALALGTHAATITWDGGGVGNNWTTGDNWSGTPDNTQPGSGDLAVLTAGTIEINSNVGTVQNLNGLSSGIDIDMTGGTISTSGGGAQWFNYGTWDVTASSTVNIGSFIRFGGNAVLTVDDSTFNATASIENRSAYDVYIQNGATFTANDWRTGSGANPTFHVVGSDNNVDVDFNFTTGRDITFRFVMDNDADPLSIFNTVGLDLDTFNSATLIIDTTDWNRGAPGIDTNWQIFSGSGLSGTFDNVLFEGNGGSFSYRLDYAADAITIGSFAVIPEPSTFPLVLGGICFVRLMRRKFRA